MTSPDLGSTGGPVHVFAREDRSLQLHWSRLPHPEATIEVGGRTFEVGSAPPPWYRQAGGRPLPAGSGGPGALTVEGLEPATVYDVVLGGAGRGGGRRRVVARVRTLPPPPGRLLSRFATVSDCHIGEKHLGLTKRLHDPWPRPEGLEPYPVRCLRAAVIEAEEWGAQALLAKGDLTQNTRPDQVAAVADVLAGASIPVEVVLGNHDVRGRFDAAGYLAARGLGDARGPRAVDYPGVRVVLGHSPIPGHHAGRVDAGAADALATLAHSADGAVVVVLHHPPRRLPVETHYPPSISWRHSVHLTRALTAANPSTLLLAGHTHRNRRYRVGGLTVAEVGSPKDYPGQWAGYAVHEGGIRQVVRRVEHPDAIAWTEMTRRAIGGVWGHWSPGRMADRCWTLEWPDRIVAA